MDLPLKNQKEIHQFFEDNKGKEFVQLGTKEYIDAVKERFQYYWLFQEQLGNGKKNKIYRIFNKFRYGTIIIQSILKVDRRKNNKIFDNYYAGPNWFSITHDFAEWIVNKEKDIWTTFHKTICCDEVFLQTLLMNSPFKDNIYYEQLDGDYHAIMRKIDWNRGKPYVWLIQDYDELINSEFLFARKFSVAVDESIVDKIFEKLYYK